MRKAALVIALCAVAASMAAGQPQPTSVPGWFEFKKDAMPSVASVAARPATDHAVYGIYAWHWEVGYAPYRQAFKDIGFSTLRLAGPVMETNGSGLRWGDEAFGYLAQLGIEVMLTLQLEGSNDTRERFASDDAFIQAYLNHIAEVLNRYGPGGDFWASRKDLPYKPLMNLEIWNEPNFQYMYPTGSDPQRQALYAKLLSSSYAYIKANWPSIRVVGFGAGGESAADKGFIASVLSKIPVGSMNVLSTHPYIGNRPPESYLLDDCGGYIFTYSIAQSLNDIRTTLGGDSMPIWYTEVGWQISQADGGGYSIDASKTVPRLLQGAYICRLYAWALRLGVDRVHIMFTKDTDGYNGGIFENDGTWRESAYAIQTMVKVMPHPQLTGAIADNENGYFAYRYRSDSANPQSYEAIMAWNGSGPKTVTIPVSPGKYKIVSMLGLEQTVNAASGSIIHEVGPYPIYIIPAGSSFGLPSPKGIKVHQ